MPSIFQSSFIFFLFFITVISHFVLMFFPFLSHKKLKKVKQNRYQITTKGKALKKRVTNSFLCLFMINLLHACTIFLNFKIFSSLFRFSFRTPIKSSWIFHCPHVFCQLNWNLFDSFSIGKKLTIPTVEIKYWQILFHIVEEFVSRAARSRNFVPGNW